MALQLFLGIGIAESAVASSESALQLSGVVSVTGDSGALITVVFQGTNGSVTKVVTGQGSSAVAVLLEKTLNTNDLLTLGEGLVSVSASQALSGGGSIEASPISFTLDSIAPTLSISSDKTSLRSGETAQITFSFSEDPGNSFVWDGLSGDVQVSGGSLSAITGSGLTRTALFTPKPGIQAGSCSISVSDGLFKDAAGNSGVGSSLVVSLDTQNPTTTVATAVLSGTDTGISNTDWWTQTSGLSITGTLSAPLEAGETLRVSTDGGSNWTNASASVGSTNWSANLALSGSGTFKAKLVDTAGNEGPVFSKAYAIDAAAPTLVSQYPAAAQTNVFVNHSIVLSFSEDIFAGGGTITAQRNTDTGNAIVITLTAGQATGSFTTGAVGTGVSSPLTQLITGTWTIAGNKLILDPTSSLITGSTWNFDINANALTDRAGNPIAPIASTSSSGIYFTTGSSTDSTGPTIDVNSVQFSDDTGASSTDFNTSKAVQTISGVLSANLAAGDLVQLSLDGGVTWVYANQSATGSNQFSHTLTLLPGTNAVRVRVVDAAGNRARSGGFIPTDLFLSRSYTLDTTPPAAPGLSLAAAVVNGANKDEALQATGVVTVTGQAGFAIQVIFQGSNGTVTKLVSGSGATAVPVVLTATDLPFLGAGVISVSAVQIDVAGNQSSPSSASFVFDAVPPNARVQSLALGPDSAGNGTSGTTSDFITNSSAQVITGSLSEALGPNEVVRVSIDNGVSWLTATTIGTSWSCAATLASSNTLIARVEDNLGNFSAPVQQAYVLDVVAEPPTLLLGSGVANGATASEATQASGVLSVGGEVGAAISVVFSGSAGSVTKNLIGTGALQPVLLNAPDLDQLGDGTVNVQVSQTDIAGNTASSSTAFVLDRIAPLPPLITSKPLSSNIRNHTIQGTSEAFATITVREGATVLGTTVADASGRWEALVDLPGAGIHSITATQTDKAGNNNPTPSAPVEITIDAPAPTPLLTKEDLQFILLQIGIAEAHDKRLGGDTGITADFAADGLYNIDASQAALRLALGTGNDALPLGLRSVEGFNNNLQPNQARFGSADRSFSPATIGSTGVPTLTTNYDPDGSGGTPSYAPTPNTPSSTTTVTDSSPRLISNLIADQTTNNPASVSAAQHQQALLDPELQKSANPQALQPQTDVKNTPLLNVLNTAPNPANAPYNSFLTLFGQGFDHGLDFIDKGNSGKVLVPLLPGDPLYVQGAPTNFMTVTRATVDAQGNTTNRTTPWIDMNQAYGSHSSMQVFLREYLRNGSATLPTGKMLSGGGDGLPTWAEVKAQAKNMLGIVLTDQDVGNAPLIVADEYGRFIPGANGFPQVVVTTGTDGSGNPIIALREGSEVGLALSGNGYAALRTGHAFLLDIAHTAAPNGKTADADSSLGLKDANNTPLQPNQQGQYSNYDNELLDAHYVAGDGRVNENQGLTAFHTMFHNEHDRLVDDYKRIAVESGDLNFLNSWLITPLSALPASVAEVGKDNWNGERLFQAARFMTEMQYQHGVFEEFARFIDPNVAADQGYLINLDPAITREFANVVYRFGHSMLNETVDRFSADWQNTSEGLIASFLNPREFVDPDGNAATPDITAADGGGQILRGMTRQQGNAIDELVTGALRNNLVGLPLDLAAINLTRARELGIPRLNDARQQFFNATQNQKLAPYSNWWSFAGSLKYYWGPKSPGQPPEDPGSLVNFIAAYGNHPELIALRDPNNTDTARINKLRAIALALVNGTHLNSQGKNDSADFMNAAGSFASRRAGVDDIDFWIGGLAEKSEAQVTVLGSTFAFVFEQQLQALQNADRLYYLRRLPGNLLTQIEQGAFSAMAQRSLYVSSLPGHLFSMATYTLEVNAGRQLTNLGNGKADPVGANRVNASASEIGYSVANSLRWNGGHVVLAGSEDADLLQAGNENDTLYGRGGDDVMFGGDGSDQIWGGDGNDFIFDSTGANVMRGESGDDVIVGGSTGAVPSLLFGGSGKDWMIGGVGGIGNEMAGETGDDFISASDGGTLGNGGAGDDWFEGNSLGGVDLYNLDDGMGALVNINGNAVPQAVGHDVSLSRAGDDKIFGDYGNDLFVDGSGFDDYAGQQGFDWVSYARNGTDPGGANNGGGSIDLGQIVPQAVLRNTIQVDLTDLRVESAGGSQYGDILVGDDRTDLVGGNVFLNRNNDLAINGLDRDLMLTSGQPGTSVPADNALSLADLVLKGNIRNPVVNTHYDRIVDPGSGQLVWGAAGGISVNRLLDDRLVDLPLDSGGIRGLFSDYTSSGGGSFKSLIPAALQQTEEVNTRPNPLGVGINIAPVIVNSVPNSSVPGFPNVQGKITVPAYFNAGNVLIGGQGSDVIFGKAGDDVIDGDAWLNVELEWRNPSDPSKVMRFADMKAVNDAQLVLGLAIKPQDVHIVRELASNPYESGSNVTQANDMAVYYGRPDEYLFEGQRRVYVSSIATGGLLQTDAIPADYEEDPLTGRPINYPTTLGLGLTPAVREVDLNGANLATLFDNNLLNSFHPRTTIIGAPMDVDGDGFIALTYSPTQAQLSDPLRLVAPAPGVALPVLQGTDYLRNIETVRFVLPSVTNPTGKVNDPNDPLSGLVNPTTYSTYTSRIGSAGNTYTYSTYRDGTFVDTNVFNNGALPLSSVMPKTAAVMPGVSNGTTPTPDANTSKAPNLIKDPGALPSFSIGLTNDTGRSQTDNISKQADITITVPEGLGYLYQWSNTADYFSPAWRTIPGVTASATTPTSVTISQAAVESNFGLSQGVNTLYFRLIENKDGGRIGSSQTFAFNFDTTAPAAPIQTGVADGFSSATDPWQIESGARLFYDSVQTGSFTSTSQPSTKPYYTLQEDTAGNRSAVAKSAFFYNLKSPNYNDGNTTTPGNTTPGVGYLLISNYQPGEKLSVDIGNKTYFLIDNYTTGDSKVGIGVFLDDGTANGKNSAVTGAWDSRDELLALIQTPNTLARMFTKVEDKDATNTVTARTYWTDPASVALKTFASGAATREALQGSTAVIDTFKINSLSDVLLPTSSTTTAAFDRITNFNTTEDIIDDGRFTRTSPISPTIRTTAVTALTTNAIGTQLTKSTFVANGAATFVFGSGATQRTFLAINDGTAGFGNGDGVVEITGYTGPLTSLVVF